MSVRVRKANGERVVPEEKVAEYLEMGYSVIDSKGNIIKRPDPKTSAEFKAVLAEKEKLFNEATFRFDEEVKRLNTVIEEYRTALAEKDKQIAELEAKSASAAESKKGRPAKTEKSSESAEPTE